MGLVTAISDALRNVISSSLIIQGNTQQSDDFFPCYQYPLPAAPLHWGYDGFNSKFMNAAKPPSERHPGISAYGAGLPGNSEAQGKQTVWGECLLSVWGGGGTPEKSTVSNTSSCWRTPALGAGQNCHLLSVWMGLAAVAVFALFYTFFFFSSIFQLFPSDGQCTAHALFHMHPITIPLSMTTFFPFCRRET